MKKNIKLRYLKDLRMTWEKLEQQEEIKLYAGGLSKMAKRRGFIGLCIDKKKVEFDIKSLPSHITEDKEIKALVIKDAKHVFHDISNPMPLSDNKVDVYQAEDVFEHIEFNKLPEVMNEVYRVLKPDGLFRLSVPDYGCNS